MNHREIVERLASDPAILSRMLAEGLDVDWPKALECADLLDTGTFPTIFKDIETNELRMEQVNGMYQVIRRPKKLNPLE